MIRRSYKTALGFMLASGIFFSAFQSKSDLSESLQLQVLVKSFSYDRNLTGGNIVLIAASASSQNQSRMKSAIESASPAEKTIKNSFELKLFTHLFTAKAALQNSLTETGAHIVYLCDDLSEKEVGEIVAVCAQKGILTTTGVPDLVIKGHASLSAVKISTIAKPIINTTRVSAEKHFFIYSFQKICRVIE